MRWLLTSPSKFATIDTIRPLAVRSSQEIARFFDRLELLIESGVVSVSLWRPTAQRRYRRPGLGSRRPTARQRQPSALRTKPATSGCQQGMTGSYLPISRRAYGYSHVSGVGP